MALAWPRRLPRSTAAVLALASALTIVAAAARCGHAAAGLAFTATPERAQAPSLEDVRPLDASALRGLRQGSYRVAWRGFWVPGSAGTYRVRVRSQARFALRLDGRRVLGGQDGSGRGREHARLELEARPHAIELELRGVGKRTRFRITRARGSEEQRPFPVEELVSGEPGRAGALVARAGRRAAPLALLAWAVGLGLVAWRRRSGLREWLATGPGRLTSPVVPWTLAGLVVLYAGALRTEALIVRYGNGDLPGWARRLEEPLRALHPARLRWKPVARRYEGDPGAYLRHAREMERFYDARFREPFFVFAAKAGVALAGGRDLGISLASSAFSTLAVAATFLLGAAFSPWIGLLAAVGFAIDQQVITLSPEGWRDDAFAFLCAAFAWTALRLHDRGRFGDALALGVLGGIACLTRVTSLSFVVPALLALAFLPRSRERRIRLDRAAVAALVCAALLVPFLMSCWIAWGDPLISINGVAPAYQAASGIDTTRDMGVVEYLAARFRPYELLDTVLVGSTAYPFANKWNFGAWSPGLATPAATAGAVGLLLLCLVPRGRLLLLVFAAALFPFTLTWNVRAGDAWRLTLFAYPFYLVAAAWALCGLARLAVDSGARARLKAAVSERGTRIQLGAVVGMAGLVVVAALVLPYVRVRESLSNGRTARVAVGPRDALFFGAGWEARTCSKNTCERRSVGRTSSVRLPLVTGQDYTLRVRAHPMSHGQPPARLVLLANGSPLGALQLQGGDLAQEYRAPWPARAVRDGRNDLEIRAESPDGGAAEFALLYVEIAPEGSASSESPARRRRGRGRRAP